LSSVENSVHFPCQLATKIDWETIHELEDIALYEKKRRATLVRDIILEKVRVYSRNPTYKRFKKQLEEAKSRKTET